MWFDFAAIPVYAPDADHACAFRNYQMEPQVMAAITNIVGQPSGAES